jgi:glycine/betaine/sarcosine/D-proline reductase family selenoprotein B
VWLRYPIGDRAELAPEDYLSVHAGFDTTAANLDPDRLVPLDAARELVERGRIGGVHDEFFTTTGVDTPVAVATRMGQEIGAEIRNAGVDAVILTGT